MRESPVEGPDSHRLRHQSNRRHQVQHAPAPAHLLLGRPQSDKRLACAAWHVDLATIVRVEALGNRFERLDLVAAGLSSLAELDRAGILEALRPPHRPAVELVAAENLAALGGLLDLAPRLTRESACRDQKAACERLLAGLGQKTVDVFAGHRGARLVQLALDGAHSAIDLLSHEIHAGVAAVPESAPLRPVGPQPNSLEAVAVLRVALKSGAHHTLEDAAPLLWGVARLPKRPEHLRLQQHPLGWCRAGVVGLGNTGRWWH